MDREYAIYKVELAYLETHKIVLDFQLYLGGFNYTVYTTGTNRYFLRNKSGNDAIFIHLLWCKQFISSPLLDDVFPECETLDDLSCIVRALLKELLNRMGKEDPTPQKILRMTDGLSLLQVETKPKLIKL